GLASILKADGTGTLLAAFDEKVFRGWRLMDADGEVRGDLVMGSGNWSSGGVLHVAKNAAYVLNAQFGVTAVRLDTGEIMWTVGREIIKARYTTDVTVHASEVLVAVTNGRGKLQVLEAGSGRALWSYRLTDDEAYPFCDGDSVFLVDGPKLLYFKQSSQE